jgi:integrase/recombinase XerD
MAALSDEQLYDRFLEDLDCKGDTKSTIQNYGSSLKDFMSFIHKKDTKFTDIQGKKGKDILVDYLNYLRKKPINGNGKNLQLNSIKKYFSALNTFYDYLFIREELVDTNIVLPIRKYYLKQYKNGYTPEIRKIISVEEMRTFLKGIFNLQDKTICVVFVKTGVRRGELMAMDTDDVDLDARTITVKRTFHKRSNCIVIFDEECKRILQVWLKRRETLAKEGETALFLNEYGHRIHKNKAYTAVTYWSKRMGYHNTNSSKLSDHFTPHNLRHCWTTYLSNAKMYEPWIQWLRGDAVTKAIDIYKHPTIEKIRDAYDISMPVFGL